MKMTLIASTYPLVLEGVIKDELQNYFQSSKIKDIFKKTNTEYKEIIKRAPDIGGKDNMFLDIYYLGAYVIALYKNINLDITLEQLDNMLKSGIEGSDFLRKKLVKVDPLSLEYKEELKKASNWSIKNKDKYPSNWILSFKETTKSEGIYFEFSRCGLCNLCKQEDVLELIPSLCKLDYIILTLANCKLERNKTIGNGDKVCDFWIKSK